VLIVFKKKNKEKLENVIFSNEYSKDFDDYNLDKLVFDKIIKIYFPNEKIMRTIKKCFDCKCPECGSVLKTKVDLLEHVEKIHKKSFW
jgi:S-adenosylmethionine synthetase